MAERHSPEKMAVSANNKQQKDATYREEVEQKPAGNNVKPATDGVPKKRGTFKITSIKMNEFDGDSLDDLDESHTELTEDPSSEMLDVSRSTDVDQDTPIEEMNHVNSIVLTVKTETVAPKEGEVKEVKEKPSDFGSRFRVVKIETQEPFQRGRWSCQDYLDPQPSAASSTEKSETKVNESKVNDDHSGSSSASSSVHYVHGVDDPSKNPLLAGGTGTVSVPSQINEGQLTNFHDSFQPINPAPSTLNNQPVISNVMVNQMGPSSNQIQCQNLNQSHSQQNLNALGITDSIQLNQPEGHSGQMMQGNQILVTQPNVYMPHYSTGKLGDGMSMANITNETVMQPVTLGQQRQGQPSNTYQTYVHLAGPQMSNAATPIVHKEGIHSVSSSESGTSFVSASDQQMKSDSMANISTSNLPLSQSLDKDLANPLLSPLAAAVGDLQSPKEEDSSGSALKRVGRPNRLPSAVNQEMEPGGVLRRYSLQESQYPVQADPGLYPEYVALPRQMSYPSSPERMMKMRHVSVPMGLPPHMQQEIIANHANHGKDKVRRHSLQEHKKHVSFSHNSAQQNVSQQEPKQELSRHVSYPNGPGSTKMRRFSVCAVPQRKPSPPPQKKYGSSTVAIDNKIEQAMDLVKSHLMFAVREEVDDLKIQIAELIERNNQLEYENSILRAAATPETLAKLAQPRQQPPPSSS